MIFMLLLSFLLVIQQIGQAAMIEYGHIHAQRQLLFTQMINATHRKCPKRERKPRRFWIRPGRTSLWWDNFLNGVMLEEEWKENFRMSCVSFFNLVSPYIERQVTIMRSPASTETQVALTLYYFSDEGRLRKVANSFGLSRLVCSIIIRRVSSVIITYLGPAWQNQVSKKKYPSFTMHFQFLNA